jgi:YfiR/HmsC-like
MSAPIRRFRLRHFIGVALLATLLSGAHTEAPKSRHAAIVARVLSYELTLDERAGQSVEVAVVYRRDDAASESNADEWVQGFAEIAPVKVKDRQLSSVKVPYGMSDLNAAIDRGADVLLVAEGLDSEASSIAQLARSRRVLTAGNSVSYVQKDLTLCVTEEGDKTRIFINLNAAQSERIRFGSRLLALATIIR